jgi:hypothetical protein
MITMTIMIILYLMVFGFGSEQNQRQQRRKCRTNLQKLYVALQIYANDNAGRFPVVADARTSEEALAVLVPRYSADTAIFICPGSKDPLLPPGEPLARGGISYAYYMGRRAGETTTVLLSDRQVNTLAKTAGQSAFSSTGKPPGNNHHKYGGNLLYCDGGMQSSPPVLTIALPLATNVTLLNPRP